MRGRRGRSGGGGGPGWRLGVEHREPGRVHLPAVPGGGHRDHRLRRHRRRAGRGRRRDLRRLAGVGRL
ncbi:hypothetical protein D0Z08_08460 [Nocardioides immobilis]|uniref:Uncharacterized protein n=1 Tax=Nocardioides immobilis TaxID=2049295 RepID=A0A417Y539_9ACTN|nr:hypothetical protein D0Z08_08460 [Nocardioides immobilis]